MSMKKNTTKGSWEILKPALYVQLIQLALTLVWNIAGVILISRGLRALGPVASLAVAAIALVFGIVLVVSLRRWPVLYGVFSVVIGLMAIWSVVNAFTANPALWPSDFWRYAGAAVNVIGIVGFVMAVVGLVKWKKMY